MSKVIEQIKRHEGFRTHMYLCTANKNTIGYGYNLDAGMTEEEAEALLNIKLRVMMDSLMRSLSFGEREVLLENQPRYAVIQNMVYNLGVRGLLNFKKMRAAIANEAWDLAADEMMDSKWARQVGSRANELSEQMRDGVWQI